MNTLSKRFANKTKQPSQPPQINQATKQPVETQSTEAFLAKNQVSLGDIDIDPTHTVLSVSSRAEEKSRLQELEADGTFRRWKDLLTHSAVLVLVTVVLTSSLFTLHSQRSSPQDKEGARTIVTAIVGGAVGYIFGKGKDA